MKVSDLTSSWLQDREKYKDLAWNSLGVIRLTMDIFEQWIIGLPIINPHCYMHQWAHMRALWLTSLLGEAFFLLNEHMDIMGFFPFKYSPLTIFQCLSYFWELVSFLVASKLCYPARLTGGFSKGKYLISGFCGRIHRVGGFWGVVCWGKFSLWRSILSAKLSVTGIMDLTADISTEKKSEINMNNLILLINSWYLS